MRNMASEIVQATQAVAKELGIPHSVIALKSHYTREVSALKEAIAVWGPTSGSMSWRASIRRAMSRASYTR